MEEDIDTIEQQQEELRQIIEKVEQARVLLVQKLQPPTDGSPWDQAVGFLFFFFFRFSFFKEWLAFIPWPPSPVLVQRAEKFEQRLRGLLAERDHLLYQQAELDKAILFNNPEISMHRSLSLPTLPPFISFLICQETESFSRSTAN